MIVVGNIVVIELTRSIGECATEIELWIYVVIFASICNSTSTERAQGKRDEAEAAKSRTTALKELSKELETKMKETTEQMNSLIVTLPNLPA